MKPLLHFFLSLIILWVSILIPAIQSQCIKDQQQSLLRLKKSLVFHFHAPSTVRYLDPSYTPSGSGPYGRSNGSYGRSNGSITIDPSTKLVSWNASTDCCSWVGITCNRDGRVLRLDLHSQDISTGINSSSSLFHLHDLQSLNLAYNNFGYVDSQSIPSAIGNLLNLRYLDLHGNNYSGQIPIEISRLRKLVVLDLSYNPYLSSGAISSSLPNLMVLSMSYCNLSGPLLQSLAKLQSLSVIRLDHNPISAPVPKFLANFSNLTVLSLSGCELQGTFPKEIFQLPSLQSIDISDNYQLGGSLPEFSNNGSLQDLNLRGTNLSGLLPNSIGNLRMLSSIDIDHCSFTGPIPKSMANLTKLIDLDLSFNKLDGNIPASLFSLPLLDSLDLSGNNFSGPFPEISNVSSYLVNSLDLSSNHLEGPIPMSIFCLQDLQILDLSSNNFSGSFPLDGLNQLRDLSVLDLSHNNLFLTHDYTNFSYSSLPQISSVSLVSLKLRTIPNFLRNQSHLQLLELSENQISGKVPNWIWNLSSTLNLSCNSLLDTLDSIDLTSLYSLDLHSNQFHGKIPTFQSAQRVYYLDFSRNHFNSTIPSAIGDVLSDVTFLSFSSNNLSGIIPESLCHSANLRVLDLSNNSLSGTVPLCLTATTELSVLNLRINNLTNVDEFSHNCSLKTLDISGNQIQGRFLKSLVNCTQLEVLNLGNNLIREPFPCFLRNTDTLRVLVLRSNKFYGGIGCGKTKGTWPLLQIIDLAHNIFSGEVPGTAFTTWQGMRTNKDNVVAAVELRDSGSYYQVDTIPVTQKGREIELVYVLTIFTSIDFSCNKFNGSIPEDIGELRSLYALNLSNNAFTGALPSSLSNMRELESMDLSKNKLSGQIPPELTKLTFLAFLNLSCNQLVGRIPSGPQFLTFDAASFDGNKGLWGPPLTADNRTGFSSPKLEGNHSDPGNEIDWEIICPEIGFTCGFGVAIGSLLFCKRWRKWYFRAMYHILLKVFPQLEERFGRHRRHVYIHQRYWRR